MEEQKKTRPRFFHSLCLLCNSNTLQMEGTINLRKSSGSSQLHSMLLKWRVQISGRDSLWVWQCLNFIYIYMLSVLVRSTFHFKAGNVASFKIEQRNKKNRLLLINLIFENDWLFTYTQYSTPSCFNKFNSFFAFQITEIILTLNVLTTRFLFLSQFEDSLFKSKSRKKNGWNIDDGKRKRKCLFNVMKKRKKWTEC